MGRQPKYRSEIRASRARETKRRILESAKRLFVSQGFERTTIEKIARKSGVAAPTVYALFRSKVGLLKSLIEFTIFDERYDAFLAKYESIEDPIEALRLAAPISRSIYGKLSSELAFLHSLKLLSPELKKIASEIEQLRYDRQYPTIQQLHVHKLLKPCLTASDARDIMWAITGFDVYRHLVLERGWSVKKYENWLANTLQSAITDR